MQENLTNIVLNTEQMADLEANSARLKQTGFEVSVQSSQLKKQARHSQLRMYTIGGLIATVSMVAVVSTLLASS